MPKVAKQDINHITRSPRNESRMRINVHFDTNIDKIEPLHQHLFRYITTGNIHGCHLENGRHLGFLNDHSRKFDTKREFRIHINVYFDIKIDKIESIGQVLFTYIISGNINIGHLEKWPPSWIFK